MVGFILIIIGSAFFIPVSCTIGTFSGTFIGAALDSRDVSEGDSVHTLFSIAVQEKNKTGDLQFVSLDQAEQLKATGEPFTFLMSAADGTLDDGSSVFTFQVLEDHKEEQPIEVVETDKDGDNTIRSRYRATETDMYPASSGML